jgi:hypothetical protein
MHTISVVANGEDISKVSIFGAASMRNMSKVEHGHENDCDDNNIAIASKIGFTLDHNIMEGWPSLL